MDTTDSRLEPRHPIGVVCHRARMKPDRIRAWERRYGVVAPVRSEGNQRLYSDADIERLALLRQATTAGHRIAGLAALSDADLRELVRTDVAQATPTPWLPTDQDSVGVAIRECLFAVQRLDRQLLRETLDRAQSQFDLTTFIERLLAPLVHRIGELWAEGGMSPAHEHMATSVLRVFIEGAGDRVAAVAPGPTLLVTTPSGQRHEIGALLALASAASVGWKVAYLGPDLPAEEIASAARQTQAAAVALSIVYPENDPDLEGELQTLRRHLSSDVHVLVGGRAAAAYATAIDAIGGVLLGDLSGFRATLEQLATSRNTTGEIR